ncbi:MAG: DUF2480 family protein [Candidatus Zixiibacteriota bacterium]
MAFAVVDPSEFLSGSVFKEDIFLSKANATDWSLFKQKKVLIRGCSGTVIPPWAFMFLTGKLAPHAKTVLYGNEHDNVVVYRQGESS